MEGPKSRWFELRRALRIFGELIRGFRALHFVGPLFPLDQANEALAALVQELPGPGRGRRLSDVAVLEEARGEAVRLRAQALCMHPLREKQAGMP